VKTDVLGKIALSSITGTSLDLTTEEVSELHGYIEGMRATLRSAEPMLAHLATLTNDRNDFISIIAIRDAATKALKEGA
jgi:hypothetical protein